MNPEITVVFHDKLSWSQRSQLYSMILNVQMIDAFQALLIPEITIVFPKWSEIGGHVRWKIMITHQCSWHMMMMYVIVIRLFLTRIFSQYISIQFLSISLLHYENTDAGELVKHWVLPVDCVEKKVLHVIKDTIISSFWVLSEYKWEGSSMWCKNSWTIAIAFFLLYYITI